MADEDSRTPEQNQEYEEPSLVDLEDVAGGTEVEEGDGPTCHTGGSGIHCSTCHTGGSTLVAPTEEYE